MESTNQRATYRVEYPRAERPTLHTDDRTFDVLDCSESGLRIEPAGPEPPPRIGVHLRGLVRFRDGSQVDVEGVVARREGRSLALRFTGAAVPYATVLAEQKRLRRAFLAQKGRRP